MLVPELETDGKMKSIKRHIAVRWLSRSASIDSLVEPLGPLVSFLHEEKARKSKKRKATDDEEEDGEIGEAGHMSLDELCSAYSQFNIVAMLHFLGDLCEQLAVASRTLQGDITDVDEVLSNMQGLVDSLANDYPATGPISWGARMRKFLARAGASIGTSTPRDIKLPAGTEKEHVIKVAVGERGKFYQAVRCA